MSIAAVAFLSTVEHERQVSGGWSPAERSDNFCTNTFQPKERR